MRLETVGEEWNIREDERGVIGLEKKFLFWLEGKI